MATPQYRVRENSTSIGLGPFALAGAPLGFRTFAAVVGLNGNCRYCIESPQIGEWEIGDGTLTAPAVLTRGTVVASSAGGTPVDFSPGDKNVYVTEGDTTTGGDDDDNYTHTQNLASTTWHIAHNLGKRTSIIIVDSAGTEVQGDVNYVDDNNVTVSFSAPFSGYAYLN